MTEEQSTDQLDESEQSQEDPETFDAEYVAKLRKEAAKYRLEAKANAEAAEKLAAIEEANKTEQQRLEERVEAAEKSAAEAQTEAMRYRVAAEHGIKPEHMKFLTGDTEEEMVDRAKDLADLYEASGKPRPYVDPVQRRSTTGAPTPAEQFAATFEGRI